MALMARSPDSQRQRMFSGHENAPSFLTFLIAIHLATAVVLFAFVLRDWIEIFKGPGAFGPCPQNQSVRHLRQTRVAPRRGHRSRWHWAWSWKSPSVPVRLASGRTTVAKGDQRGPASRNAAERAHV